MRVWLVTLLLLVALGLESWPDARLALDFALSGLIRVWLKVFRQKFSSRFARKLKFKFCSRYSNKIFLRASRESLSLSSMFQLFPVSRFMSYQGIQMAHLAKH